MSKCMVHDCREMDPCPYCSQCFWHCGDNFYCGYMMGRKSYYPKLQQSCSDSAQTNAKDLTPTEGVKHDDGKLRFDLLPPHALEQVVEIFTFGATKYGDRNWELGMDWARLFGAMSRHTWAWYRGEDTDSESGKSHLAHAVCCLLMLLEYAHTKKGRDNRPYGGAV